MDVVNKTQIIALKSGFPQIKFYIPRASNYDKYDKPKMASRVVDRDE